MFSRRCRLKALLVATPLFALSGLVELGDGEVSSASASASTKVTAAMAELPPEVPGSPPTQQDFDRFAWLSFIALNWPADPATCGPNKRASILDGKGPLVWETYAQPSTVFVKPPARPDPWCGPAAESGASRRARLPGALAERARRTGVGRVFELRGKAQPLALSGEQEIFQVLFEVLVDQNGRFVRYEIRLNEPEYRYLVDNELWSARGQAAFGRPIALPSGAIEIKAAWKVLGRGDDPRRFHTTRAIVANDAEGSPSPEGKPVTLGLVGLHIIRKTPGQPNWVWSTFEHVDNLSRSFQAGQCPDTPPYTAKAPAPCPTRCCPPNTPTACCPPQGSSSSKASFEELKPDGASVNSPTQVTRVAPIEASAQEANREFQTLLAGSLWANYFLVGTQWVDGSGLPQPPFLANTVIETFLQGPPQPTDGPVAFPSPGYSPFTTAATSSCVKCHRQATLRASPARPPTDFSFLFNNAQ